MRNMEIEAKLAHSHSRSRSLTSHHCKINSFSSESQMGSFAIYSSPTYFSVDLLFSFFFFNLLG